MRCAGLPIMLCAIGLTAGISTLSPAAANIFTHIAREAGEAGGKAASHGLSHLGPVGKAAAHIKALPLTSKGALAAHATPEGHWQFVNRDGQVFTAGTPDELKRVLPTLAPEAIAAGESKLSLFVSEDSIFDNRAALSQLPSDTELHVVTERAAFRVTRSGTQAAPKLTAQIKPNLIVNLSERVLFDETIAYLSRPLNRSNIRTIAIEPSAKKRLPAAPQVDPSTKVPQVDQLDPANLETAFGSIRGQTILVAGRVENGRIAFSPSSGPEVSRDVADLSEAARNSDVNLVLLHTDAPRQPGGRNWFWQTIEVGGMSDASKAATFGDFLEVLAQRRGGFQISATQESGGRVHLSAQPSDAGSGIANDASSWLDEAVGHVTGEIVTAAVDVHGRDQETQSEFDARLIPGIPSYVQIPYLVSLVCGLIAWSTARGWWSRVWAPRPGKPGTAHTTQVLSNLPREVAFLFAFLPIAGFPALLWHMAVQTWASVTAPFRWIHRRFLRREV